MKTPRELLFERHRAAETKLDAVRESVVATIGDRRERASAGRPTFRELLLSLRWHFATLSAAWLVVLLLNLESSSTPATNLARENHATPKQLMASLEAYREQLRQFLEQAPDEPPIVPPRRSDIRNPKEVV